MADVARLAGVSASTVSRAFAGSTLVPPATRDEILRVAKDAGYVVNRSAQRLRNGRTDTVGIVVPLGSEPTRALSDPFFLQIIGQLADAISARGYDVLLIKMDAAGGDALERLAASQRADGLIIVGQSDQHEALNQLAGHFQPFVVWGACLPGQAYCSVGVDNVGGGVVATARLLEYGRRRVAFVGPVRFPEAGLRHDGYLAAHAKAGVRVAPELHVDADFSAEATMAAMAELDGRGEPYDAVFAASDVIAIAAMAHLRATGRRVPEDVAVVGFDDLPIAAHAHPPLTTVRQDLTQGALFLVENLFRRMAGDPAPSSIISPKLVVRDSG